MLEPIQFLLLGVLLASATASAEPTFDPFDLVRLASDRVSAASLSFHVEKRFDVVRSDGAKVEYSGALDVMATRSKGLFMDYGDDLSAKRVWYDGRTMTILDSLKKLYATVAVKGTVSEALTRVARDYGAELPQAPLLKKNLLQELESSLRASYLGIHDARTESSARSGQGGDNAAARQGHRTDTRGGRQDSAADRQTDRSNQQGERTDNRSDRQEENTERQGNRQDGRTDRTETRQDGYSDRTQDRADYYDNYWGGYHHDHHHGWDDDNEWWALAAGLVIGAAIATPPPRYETVYVGTTTYYYANGYYYTPAPSGGYVVAAPPTGVTVQQPPSQVVNVTVNDQNYGYSNGAYVEIQKPEEEGAEPTFKTVEAPVGATVDYIPDGAASKTIDGVMYFVYNDVWHRPFYSGSEVVYIVAEKPEAADTQS